VQPTRAHRPDPPAGGYDAVVVGARAAGAATAMLLARWGHRVLVVDRAAYGSDTLSTLALMRPGVLQLHRWGLLDQVLATGAPLVSEVRFHLPGGDHTVAVKPSDGVPGLCAPRRTELDRILVDAAVEAGAEVRFGVQVTDVARSARGTVTGITGRDAEDGQPLHATGRIVVGADGLRSVVARRVGAPVVRAGTAAGAVAYGYVRAPGLDRYRWAYAPGVSAGLIPTAGGEAVVFAGTTPERFRSAVAGDLRQGMARIVAEASPDIADALAGGGPPVRVRGFAGVPGAARQAWGPGWVLVGDAGYWTDPLGAHGITGALRDAELAARAVHDVLGGSRSEADAGSSFQEQRDRLSAELFEVLDELCAYRWDAARVDVLLRAMSASMRPELEAITALGPVPGPAVPLPA
jgi:flavin-dependent dehydrogenase